MELPDNAFVPPVDDIDSPDSFRAFVDDSGQGKASEEETISNQEVNVPVESEEKSIAPPGSSSSTSVSDNNKTSQPTTPHQPDGSSRGKM